MSFHRSLRVRTVLRTPRQPERVSCICALMQSIGEDYPNLANLVPHTLSWTNKILAWYGSFPSTSSTPVASPAVIPKHSPRHWRAQSGLVPRLLVLFLGLRRGGYWTLTAVRFSNPRTDTWRGMVFVKVAMFWEISKATTSLHYSYSPRRK